MTLMRCFILITFLLVLSVWGIYPLFCSSVKLGSIRGLPVWLWRIAKAIPCLFPANQLIHELPLWYTQLEGRWTWQKKLNITSVLDSLDDYFYKLCWLTPLSLLFHIPCVITSMDIVDFVFRTIFCKINLCLLYYFGCYRIGYGILV